MAIQVPYRRFPAWRKLVRLKANGNLSLQNFQEVLQARRIVALLEIQSLVLMGPQRP